MKKIDAHMHVAKVIAGYCRRGELRAIGQGKVMWGNGEVFSLIPEGYGDTSFTVESAMEIMKKHEVEKAVLMQGSMYGFQNQYHYEILQAYPDIFCPSCTVDPYMTEHLQTLFTYLTKMKFHLVKFELSSGGGLMGCHDAFSLVSDRMMKIYKMIEEHHGVLALDVGDITMPSHQPENLLKIAEACPHMRIVICHLLAPVTGRELEWENSLRLLNQDNIWFDLAALPKIADAKSYPYSEVFGFLKTAKGILGSKKMMWGTDAPFAATRDTYEELTTYLETSGIFQEEELMDIFYQNADQVYFKK